MQNPRRTKSRQAAATAVLLLILTLPVAGPAQDPRAGMFLVATDEVRGSLFKETVVLLLHYESGGALGLVVNRPMQVQATEVLPGLAGIERYQGTVYWGGPVQIASLRALQRTEQPPADAVHIVDDVYLVVPDGPLAAGSSDASSLRYFLGYAGWAPGQLDGELRDGSWSLVKASSETVFDADAASMWQRLKPSETIRAALPRGVIAVD